jgi:hypothetical protein
MSQSAGATTATSGSASGISSAAGYGGQAASIGETASAGSNAMNAGSGVAGTYSSMADLGNGASSGTSGVGPTISNASSLPSYAGEMPHSIQAYNLETGTTRNALTDQAGGFERIMDYYGRMMNGANNGILDAYKNTKENGLLNAENIGYAGDKVKGMFTGGGNQPAAPININASYQPTQDEYILRRYLAKAGRR